MFPERRARPTGGTARGLAPEGLEKVFLLTTGSEATECAIKLARSHGIRRGGKKKIGIVGYERGFHGRTLGAQQAGGMPGQKSWIVNEDPAIVQLPFPDGYWTEDTSFDLFLDQLDRRNDAPIRSPVCSWKPIKASGRTLRRWNMSANWPSGARHNALCSL